MSVSEKPAEKNSILDVRSSEKYSESHPAGAANIPLDELERRLHELPPRDRKLIIVAGDSEEACKAEKMLAEKGWNKIFCQTFSGWHGEFGESPEIVKLWEPSVFLNQCLPDITSKFSCSKNALDLGCGSGRNAVFLALQGFDVTAVDRLPDAIRRCRDLAQRFDVEVTAVCKDLRSKDFDWPVESCDLVCCMRYFDRRLIEPVRRSVKPGGFVILEAILQLSDFSLRRPEPGELENTFRDWRILRTYKSKTEEGKTIECVFAEKPA
jgi:SAM-dependent methyltransferase